MLTTYGIMIYKTSNLCVEENNTEEQVARLSLAKAEDTHVCFATCQEQIDAWTSYSYRHQIRGF